MRYGIASLIAGMQLNVDLLTICVACSGQIKIKGSFSSSLFATNVVLKIPTPKNTAKCKIAVTAGKAKYKPETGGIVWK